MPSPFPGMDPYLEAADWEDFHTTFNTVLRELLVPLLRPHYLVRVERRVYVDHEWESDLARHVRPDVVIVDAAPNLPRKNDPQTETLVLEREVPMPQERSEAYLVIRSVENADLICVIETLSPSNKRPGSEGRRAYLKKRDEILASKSHLVEIDLLRGGERLPIQGGDVPGDYCAVVSPSYRRPRVQVYSWSLRQKLPAIAIPLKRDDGEVNVSLQTVFTMVYDRADYESDKNFRRALEPPLSPQDAVWANELLGT